MTFYSCEEKDDYNYDNIEPVLFSITGPSPSTAHGNTGFAATYSVQQRGGSTYNWVIGGNGGTVVQDETFPSIAYVTFNQSSVNTTATITVTETTQGGKTSEPFVRTINLLAFCPFDIDAWSGNYTGTSGAHAPTVVMEKVHGLNIIKVKGLANFVQASWGENWVKGDGSCIMEFRCGNVVNIARQWIGDTDYPDVYGIMGSGTVDVVNKTISLTYTVYFGFTATAGSVAANVTTVLTYQ